MRPHQIIGVTCLLLAAVLLLAESGVVVGPGPEPTPVPPGPRNVFLLEQDAERHANLWFADLIGDPELKRQLKATGHEYRLVDVESAGQLQPLFALAESLPWLVIAGQDTVLYSGPVPKTRDEVLALVKEHGG